MTANANHRSAAAAKVMGRPWPTASQLRGPQAPWVQLLAVVVTSGFASGCGHDGNGADPAPAPPPRYAAHEWGLIGTHIDTDVAYLATAPGGGETFYGPPPTREQLLGLQPRPPHDFGEVGHGHVGNGQGNRPHATGKPVIYLHRLDPPPAAGAVAGALAVTVSVAIPGGKVIEHWPPAALGDRASSVRWQVGVMHGTCPSSARPEIGQSPCAEVEDGYCEGAELPFYETTDAACLIAGDARYNHLFYRGRSGPAPLPLVISRDGGEDGSLAVENRGASPLPGKLIRVVERTADPAHARIAIIDPPAPGQSVVVAEPQQRGRVDEGIRALRAGLSELGMSPDESRVFLDAWQVELFGGEVAPARAALDNGTAPDELRPARQAVLYFLPAAAVTDLSKLTFTPEPAEVRRAFLVRVNTTEHPPLMGSIGTIGLNGHDLNGAVASLFGNRDFADEERPEPFAGLQENGAVPGQVLHFGSATVRGSLDAAIVRRIVRGHAVRLGACAEAPGRLLADRARVNLRIIVGSAGQVQSAVATEEVAGSDVALHGAATACLSAEARRMQFPSGGGIVAIDQPLIFERRSSTNRP